MSDFGMKDLKNILSTAAVLFLIGIILVFLSISTCQRFEPEGFLHITTDSIESLTDGNYKMHGSVVDIGEDEITQHGFCWAETMSPTTGGAATRLGSKNSKGSFSSIISSLSASTTYYVRAYVITGDGTEYGKEKTFTASAPTGPTVTDFDGNIYQTVIIGDQTWMAENLKVTHYGDGTPIPYVEDNVVWDALTETDKAYCWYDNSTSNGDTYGALYTWAGAMNGAGSSDANPSGVQGVCPAGWHLPGDTEWKQLEMYMGMSQTDADAIDWRGTDEGGKLKETGTTHWNSPNTGATNSSGFTALPGGVRGYDGMFYYVGHYAFFWTATVSSGLLTWVRSLCYDLTGVNRYNNEKEVGFSVRCVKGAGLLSLPIVTTKAISDISESSAQSGGEVTYNGGASVTARGVCWSTSQNPTISDSNTTDGSGTGSFTSSLTGLNSNTTYYIRAYATNSVGTGYGNEVSFKTWTESVTDYDGNTYRTVEIGDQIWMAENLNVTHYADGSAIPWVESTLVWDALTETDKAYCWYDSSTLNGDTYGALYTWAAVMNGEESSDDIPSGIQGVCPDDWHLPSDSEWKQLEIYLGMSQADADDQGWRGTDEGGKMKATETTLWDAPNSGATNESGFTALPGGYRQNNGSFIYLGCYAVFWTTTEYSDTEGWHRNLLCDYTQVYSYFYDKRGGFSVRCIMDD